MTFGCLLCVYSALFIGFQIQAVQAQASAPVLARNLLDSYTINPNALQYFRECRYIGDPTPVVTWTLDGQSLPAEEQTSGPYYLTGGTLVLGRASASDSGNYTCTGSNVHGSVSVSTVINISVPSGTSVWAMWWMLFIYAIALWLVISTCIVAMYLYQRRKLNYEIEHDLYQTE